MHNKEPHAFRIVRLFCVWMIDQADVLTMVFFPLWIHAQPVIDTLYLH